MFQFYLDLNDCDARVLFASMFASNSPYDYKNKDNNFYIIVLSHNLRTLLTVIN